MAIAPPKQEPLQARYATEEEWRQMDPEGYQRYQEYLHSPEKPDQVRLTPEQWQQMEVQRQAAGLPPTIPTPEQEALKEPWADPVNILAAAGGTAAAAGIKPALQSLLGNLLGEAAGGIAGEIAEKDKPKWAWLAALAVDIATGIAVDSAISRAVKRLRLVRPDLNEEQAAEIVQKAVANPDVQEIASIIPKEKVKPISDELTVGADIGLGQFIKKLFKKEGAEASQKAQEPPTSYRVGPDRRALPEGGVVVLKKKPDGLETDPDWLAGKEQGDLAAARRFADKTWTKSAMAQLEQSLPADEVVFLATPSSSGKNAIPFGLAQKLAEEHGGLAVRGDDYFDVMHKQQAKHVRRQERLFAPREFKPVNEEEFRSLIQGKTVVVVDDIYTSGGTTKAFVFTLQDMGLAVHPKVVGLYGETRFRSKPQDVARLGKALEETFGQVFKPEEVQYIAERLTRQEIGDNLLPVLYRAKGDANVRDKVSRYLQGLLSDRAPGNVGANPKPGGHPPGYPGGENRSHEKLPQGVQTRGAPGTGSVPGEEGSKTIAATYEAAGIEVVPRRSPP